MYLVFKLNEVDIHKDMIACEGEVLAIGIYPEETAVFYSENEAVSFAEKDKYSVLDLKTGKFIKAGCIEVKHWEK